MLENEAGSDFSRLIVDEKCRLMCSGYDVSFNELRDRIDELYISWSDPPADQWEDDIYAMDDLSPGERALVDQWSYNYERNISEMAKDILSLEQQKKLAMEAEASLEVYSDNAGVDHLPESQHFLKIGMNEQGKSISERLSTAKAKCDRINAGRQAPAQEKKDISR